MKIFVKVQEAVLVQFSTDTIHRVAVETGSLVFLFV